MNEDNKKENRSEYPNNEQKYENIYTSSKESEKLNNQYEDQYNSYYYRQNDNTEENTQSKAQPQQFNTLQKPVSTQPYTEESVKTPDKGMKKFIIACSIVILASSLFLLTIVGGSYIFDKFGDNKSSSSQSSSDTSSSTSLETKDHTEQEGTLTAQQVYAKCSTSIVGVLTYNSSQGLASTATSQGSGIIMSSDGYIITNAHVIGNSNKYSVTVVTSEKKEYPAKVIGFDNRTDLAVLKIDTTGLSAAEFGNSDQLQVGEWVLALGNPGGLEFSNSLTRGLVSAVNRTVTSSNSQVKYIQTDAAINPGNSGGALLNMYGQVIGINSAKITDYEGMGFAIPINTAKTIVDDIIQKGYVSGRVKLGVSIRPLSAYEAQLNDVPQGLLVSEITEDSAAAAGGMAVGDIITKIDDVSTTNTSTLYTELSKHKPGDNVSITVYRLSVSNRQYAPVELKITLAEDKG